MKKKPDKIRILTMIAAVLTAIGITYFTIRYGGGKMTLIVVPLYISICVLFLQSGVNRWAFLIGAINSLFYAAVYVYDGIYMSAMSAALFSFPFQIATFIRWKKRDSSGNTVFRTLTNKQRGLIALGYAVMFFVLYNISKLLGGNWGIYDCSSTLLGILVTVLCTFPYVEYSPLQCLSVCVGAAMFANMAKTEPLQYTYLTYQIYCLFCVIQACVRILKIYSKQKKETSSENTAEVEISEDIG